MKRAAELEPANADLGANLASALLKAGRPAEALAAAGSAIAADPSKPSA